MTYLTRRNPTSLQPAYHRGRRPGFQLFHLVPLVGMAIALASCSGDGSSLRPPFVTDTEPVGEGLKVIGYALLGASVVLVLGKMIR